MAWPHTASRARGRGHLPDEAVSLRRRLSEMSRDVGDVDCDCKRRALPGLGVLIARVRGLHEGVQAYGGMSSTGGAQGKPPYL